MKTTKKDFTEFKKWVTFYLDKFGLNDWTVYYAHDHCDGALAQCRSQIISRGVTFALTTDLHKEDYAQINIRQTARHEVCHLLIADVSNLIGTHVTKDESDRADEALVCRLTNLLNDQN